MPYLLCLHYAIFSILSQSKYENICRKFYTLEVNLLSFEKEVKIALIKKGWSQRELARQMGITVSYLRDLLKGNRNSEERLNQISELLQKELREV